MTTEKLQEKTVPEIVRHIFLFSFDLTAQNLNESKMMKCRFCGKFSDNIEESPANLVCEQRDRRRGKRRASSGRRNSDSALQF